MAGIPEHIIDQIHDRVDIVEVIGNYIPLKKTGRNYRANCPFHHEKTPSFMVSQDKQIFHCFGCGVGGNVFNFLMKYERLEFPEVVRALAQKAGVAIPASSQISKEEESLSNKLYAANDLAANFFQGNLREDRQGRQAHDYLVNRGLMDDTIRVFRLGFAVSGWETLLNLSRQKGVFADVLEKTGLAIKKEDGRYFDRFRNRIMFPILDMKSRVIGFGGRVFSAPKISADGTLTEKAGDSPKYMNSPETSVYNKGRNLYGLNFSWKAIRDMDQVIIVEGYLDLILPFQFGIKNIVASLGTSLTEDQIRLLGRYTKNAIIIFDPDKAGELATLRSLDLLLAEDFRCGVVRLPEGCDPDSFIRKHGSGEFMKRVSAAKSLFDYKMSVLIAKYDKSSLDGKAKIVGEMLPTISRVPNAVLRSGYIKALADDLLIDEGAVREELRKIKSGYPAVQSTEQPAKAGIDAANKKCRQSEKILAGLLIDDNSCIKIVKEGLSLDDFQDPIIRGIVELLFRYSDGSKTITPGRMINHFADIEVHRFITELVDCVEAVVDKEKTLSDCILRIKQDNLKERLNRLQVEIALAQNKADEDRITRLISECNTLLRSIKVYEVKASDAQNETVKA